MVSVILKKGREKSVLQHHPWIFSGAIERILGAPGSGETVVICAFDGRPLAVGAYSPVSQIAVRAWSFDPDAQVDDAFFHGRFKAAAAMREETVGRVNAVRLVAAESDGLPGLIIDRYTDWLVCQFLSAGAEHWKKTIIKSLQELWPDLSIYERSDASVREKEGLPVRCGTLAGLEPPGQVELNENGMRLLVDIKGGHKTGYYLDQRDSRAAVRHWAKGRDVLNCFSYTGGFGVAALLGGARHVTHIDSSEPALAIARQNTELNGLAPETSEYLCCDVFKELRRFRDARRDFDLIVLDPPKFVESHNQLDKGARGYKDINLLAFKLLRPGGLLFTFSCSGLMPMPLFQKIVSDAALDAGRSAQVISVLHQPPDHPVALNFPESAYLKGLLCRA
jgi:23S rRNA (cytosine1962-C5)-methyltransferase